MRTREGRGTGRAVRGALGGFAVLWVAGCGSSSSTPTGGGSATAAPTPTEATATASPTTTPSGSTPSPTPPIVLGPSIILLHTVTTNAGVDLRIATPGGGTPARSVTVLPVNSYIWAAGHGEVLVDETGSSSLVLVDLASGASHTITTQATGVSGAISPDGTKVAYLAQASGGATGVTLQVTTIATGSSQTLASYTGAAPDPIVWGPGGIVADLIVPNSDAPSQGVARLDPASGTQLGHSSGVGQSGIAVCSDGEHVITADHSSGLGDDGVGAQAGAPGPPQPPNTVRLVAVGGSQTVIRKLAHHQIAPLACPGDGSRALVMDNSAIGGFAGISQSADFGLLLVSSTGAVTQLDHYGAMYDSGAVYQDGATVAAERTDTSGATLVELAAGKAPVTLDSVPGAIGGRVDLISGG